MAVEFRHATLDNGLQVVAEVGEAAHTAAAGFFVKAGSRDEPAPLMGVSHFLEHMMFKGTERRTAERVNRDFDRIGAHHNAMTSQETTTYYAHVLPEHLGEALDILADIMRPTLRPEDFEVEKKVILEEIGMYADQPLWTAMEQAMADYFDPHPLGHRILGTRESIGALSREQMLGYFRRRYGPDNMVVSLAGRLDFDRCVAQLAEATAAWRGGEAGRDYGEATPRAGAKTLRRAGAKMHYLVGLCPGPSAQDERRYAAAVLADVLGDADGSRLYWKLIDPGLADEAAFSHHGYDRTGTFLYEASCRPEMAERVERIIDETLDAAAADELSDDEVERAASKLAMELTLQNERPAGRMMALGGQWLYLGEHLPLERELERIRAVRADDLRELLAAYPLRPRTVVRMTPEA